jgi:hypothetical protein
LRRLKLVNQGIAGAFAIIIPYSMVNVFSVKYDFARYYPNVVKASMMILGLGAVLIYNGKNQ